MHGLLIILVEYLTVVLECIDVLIPVNLSGMTQQTLTSLGLSTVTSLFNNLYSSYANAVFQGT